MGKTMTTLDDKLREALENQQWNGYLDGGDAENLLATLSAAGLAVVPVEPTEEQLDAADQPFHDEWKRSRESSVRLYGKEAHASSGFAQTIYKAMIGAA